MLLLDDSQISGKLKTKQFNRASFRFSLRSRWPHNGWARLRAPRRQHWRRSGGLIRLLIHSLKSLCRREEPTLRLQDDCGFLAEGDGTPLKRQMWLIFSEKALVPAIVSEVELKECDTEITLPPGFKCDSSLRGNIWRRGDWQKRSRLMDYLLGARVARLGLNKHLVTQHECVAETLICMEMQERFSSTCSEYFVQFEDLSDFFCGSCVFLF